MASGTQALEFRWNATGFCGAQGTLCRKCSLAAKMNSRDWIRICWDGYQAVVSRNALRKSGVSRHGQRTGRKGGGDD